MVFYLFKRKKEKKDGLDFFKKIVFLNNANHVIGFKPSACSHFKSIPNNS